jgi:DNA-binding transcriptional ArsR family regulator
MATTSSNGDRTEQELPEEVVADLLSDDTRRRALSILADRGEPVVVADLAAAVLAAQRDVEPAAVPDTDRDELTEELFTEHLPKLTATDVVTYDSMVGTVEIQRLDAVPTDRR